MDIMLQRSGLSNFSGSLASMVFQAFQTLYMIGSRFSVRRRVPCSSPEPRAPVPEPLCQREKEDAPIVASVVRFPSTHRGNDWWNGQRKSREIWRLRGPGAIGSWMLSHGKQSNWKPPVNWQFCRRVSCPQRPDRKNPQCLHHPICMVR